MMEDVTSASEGMIVTSAQSDIIHVTEGTSVTRDISASRIISDIDVPPGDVSHGEVINETDMTHVTHDMSQVDIISQGELPPGSRDMSHVINHDDITSMTGDVSHTEVVSQPDSNKLDAGSDDAILMKSSQNSVDDESFQQGEMNPANMPDSCLVCGDKGSGYHYSVFSCEGCKGFFKRTVQKTLEYVCKEGQQCVINKFTRNNCQFCRFNKCMDMGMKREAVREDRTPGGKHRHKRARVDDMPSDGMVNINTILVTGQGDELMTQKLVESRPDLIPNIEGDLLQEATKLGVNELMQYGYMELRLIIEWARKVPGFSDLLIEDQMSLLKASFMELNVFRLAYRSLQCNDSIRYAEGVVVNASNTSDSEWVKELFNCNLTFVKRLKEITMDTTEFSILNAVVLTYPDAIGVQDKLAITNLQCKILDCLHKYTCKAYPNEPKRHARMLLRLPTLRTVSAKAAECFLSMSLDGSVKMNALVLEMMS